MWSYTSAKQKRWVKSPYSKFEKKQWRLHRDYLVIVWRPFPLKYEIKMYPCQTRVVIDTVDGMNRVLSEIATLTTKEDVKTIVFVDKLDAFLEAYGQPTQYIGMSRESNGIRYNFCAVSDKFEFRNIDPLIGDREVETCDEVVECFMPFGYPAYKICWSMAHMTTKRFYTLELREKCLNDIRDHKRYFWDKELHDDMFAGSSSGHLYLDSNYQKKVLTNVSAFDKKSAYPWVLCTNNNFPLSAVKRAKYEDIVDCIKHGKWFLIVLTGIDLPNKWNMFRAKGDQHSYAWNQYDYASVCLMGYDFESEILDQYMKQLRFYVSKDHGYLLDDWRYKMVELYAKKNTYIDKEDPDRVFFKTQIDMMYGKGMQFIETFDDNDVINKYKHRPDRYILPHWSKMVVSALKYELISTYFDDAGQFYADTDGTKSQSNINDLKSLYKGYNDRIMKINKKAGFSGCDIGTWDYEYTADRFVAIAKKQYAYEIDGKIYTTIAGVQKDLAYNQIIKQQDPLQALADGLQIKKRAGLLYQKSTKEYVPKYDNYVVGDNYYEDENEERFKVF